MNAEGRRLGAAFAVGGRRYDELRPGYPADAVAWLAEGVDAENDLVADIGAGTGKLTRALTRAGLRVVAVDPSTDMLAQLSERMPGLQTCVGTGEHTTLADGSVVLATFGQSWHWVAPDDGAAELGRILRPGGMAAMVWNFLDTAVDWVAEYVAIMHSTRGAEKASHHDEAPPELGSGFGPVQRAEFSFVHPMRPDALAALVTTRSYFLAADRTEQRRVHERIRAFVDSTFGSFDVDGAGPIEPIDVPYRTFCYRSRRISSA